MSELQKINDERDSKVKELQDSCPHPSSKWMPYMWASGHFGNDVIVCDRCGKILETGETSTLPYLNTDGKIEFKPSPIYSKKIKEEKPIG